jgi:putative addiction module CopG family antidote
MNVSLTPELERLVNEKVESGLYQTASEVVREALRLLKERDQTRESNISITSGRRLAERVKSRGRAARAKKS